MAPRDGGRYFDGTLGDAGHAASILEACSPEGELAGCDIDSTAAERARLALAPFGHRAHVFNASYTDIDRICASLGWERLDGILLDLGMSSQDISDARLGFSFAKEGPLDMRYDRQAPLKAYDVVNLYPEENLARILRDYGEEPFSRRIARRIVESRPVETTTQLAQIVSEAIPRARWPKKIHPATRTFQAIRMEVNSELANLEAFLPKAASLLAPGGVLAVISFHSLEDRMVKKFMSGSTRPPLQARRLPIAPKPSPMALEPLSRRPIMPSKEEILVNPRSRSARLRAARRSER